MRPSGVRRYRLSPGPRARREKCSFRKVAPAWVRVCRHTDGGDELPDRDGLSIEIWTTSPTATLASAAELPATVALSRASRHNVVAIAVVRLIRRGSRTRPC